MKNTIFLGSLLFLRCCLQVKSDVYIQTDKENKNCTFVLSNGGYDEFLATTPLLQNCTEQFQDARLLIKLVNYNLPAFPNGTFTNLPHLKSFTLQILNGTQIQLLSPMLPYYSVFQSLSFEIAVIDISDSPNLHGWKWEALSKIQPQYVRQFVFSAFKSKLIRLDPSFGTIANGQLTAVRIIDCHLKWLGEHVFGPFSNLKNLELRKNFLENFKRSHLPNDASNLLYLDLGNNKLEYLSGDLFEDLKLKKLFLDGNNIKFLARQMDNIMSVKTLSHVYGVLWPCECGRLKQLLGRIPNLLTEQCFVNDSSIKTIGSFFDSCK